MVFGATERQKVARKGLNGARLGRTNTGSLLLFSRKSRGTLCDPLDCSRPDPWAGINIPASPKRGREGVSEQPSAPKQAVYLLATAAGLG